MVRTIEDIDRDITLAVGAKDIQLCRVLLDEKKQLTGMHFPFHMLPRYLSSRSDCDGLRMGPEIECTKVIMKRI